MLLNEKLYCCTCIGALLNLIEKHKRLALDKRAKAHSRQVGYDGLGIKVAVKSLLCYRTFHEVHFNKMGIVLLAKLTYYGSLSYLPSTCKQKGFPTSALMPLFYLW